MSIRTGSNRLSRELNRAAVLRLIGASGPIPRRDIARELGLSPATVGSVTRELLERGIVRVAETAPSNGGRPAVLLELAGSARTAFGVKIAADHLVGVRVNLEADVLERYEARFDARASDAVGTLAKTMAEWLEGADSESPLLGIGLGVPGVFEAQTGLLDSPLLGWRRLPLARRLASKLRLPVFVDNDVNTLAIAERLYGRGRAVDHFVTVTIGRGVGLGIVVGGDIYRGFRGGAGEFGHTTAVENGPLCSCGKRGCLEAVVSDPALVGQARGEGLLTRRQGIARLRALAGDGDATAKEIFAKAGATLGCAVGDLANVLGPELVLISGEGTLAWEHLADAFERSFHAALFSPEGEVSVEVDPWDDTRWAVGAAALVLRPSFTAPLDEEQPSARRAAGTRRGVVA